MKRDIAGRRIFLGLPVAKALLVVFTVGLAVPATVAGSGLTSTQLKAYYQPESFQMTPLAKPWLLPVTWQNASNAAYVRAILNLGTNATAAL